MDISTLSSNWKKLKGALQSSKQPDQVPDPPARRSAKRKPSNDTPRTKRNAIDLKRRKLNGMPHHPSKSQDDSEQQQPTRRRPSKSNTRPRPLSAPNGVAAFAREHGIPAGDITAAYGVTIKGNDTSDGSVYTPGINSGLTSFPAGKFIAIDCEMVGVGPNPNHSSQLARVSIVNYHGQQLYDSFVQPVETVTDYRTAISGIRPHHLSTKSARTFSQIQSDVSKLLKDRILIGHAVSHDLQVLLLSHPRRDIRDTSKHTNFRKINGGWTPGLRLLAKEVLGIQIQGGEHSSIEDARATMALFRKEKVAFEEDNVKRFGKVIKVETTNQEEDERDNKMTKNKKSKKKKTKKKKRTKR